MASFVIDTVPVGTLLTAHLNGRSLGITETNPETAFAYWGERQRKAARKGKRTYTLRASNGSVFRYRDNQWRAA